MLAKIFIESTKREDLAKAVDNLTTLARQKGLRFQVIPFQTLVLKEGSIKEGKKRYKVLLFRRLIKVFNVNEQFAKRIPEALKKLELKASIKLKRETH